MVNDATSVIAQLLAESHRESLIAARLQEELIKAYAEIEKLRATIARITASHRRESSRVLPEKQ